MGSVGQRNSTHFETRGVSRALSLEVDGPTPHLGVRNVYGENNLLSTLKTLSAAARGSVLVYAYLTS